MLQCKNRIHSDILFYFSSHIKNIYRSNRTDFFTFPVRIPVHFFNTTLRFTFQLVIILV